MRPSQLMKKLLVALITGAFASASTVADEFHTKPLSMLDASSDRSPACSVRLFDRDGSVSTADYRGKVVYLDFWASWCVPCRQSFPFMNELQSELGGKGVQILAVSVDKNAEEARGFLKRFPTQFTVALDVTGSCQGAFAVEALPTSFIIDRDGSLRATHKGFRERYKNEIRRELLRALEERTPPSLTALLEAPAAPAKAAE